MSAKLTQGAVPSWEPCRCWFTIINGQPSLAEWFQASVQGDTMSALHYQACALLQVLPALLPFPSMNVEPRAKCSTCRKFCEDTFERKTVFCLFKNFPCLFFLLVFSLYLHSVSVFLFSCTDIIRLWYTFIPSLSNNSLAACTLHL